MLYLVDLDGVVVDFPSAVCEAHNEKTGDNLHPEDIKTWELSDYGIENDIWQQPGFFMGLKPYEGAVEALYNLHSCGHKLWVVTYGMDIGFIEDDKAAWVREHIPFVRGIVFTDKKHLIPGDALIDDSPHFLKSYPGTTVKIRQPYNKGVVADYEFDSLIEFARAVC